MSFGTTLFSTRIVGCLIGLMLVAATSYFFPNFGKPKEPLHFSSAKEQALKMVYFDNLKTFYCECGFEPKGRTGGIIDASECGYVPRKNAERGARVEWEHIVPAYQLGHFRSCWKDGHKRCVKKNGFPFKGRKCCDKVDFEYMRASTDLMNLVPTVGELNADRANYQFGIIEGEERAYGACDFEVNFQDGVAEPPSEKMGMISRIILYMHRTYGIGLSDQEIKEHEAMSIIAQPDAWELERARRIEEIKSSINEPI